MLRPGGHRQVMHCAPPRVMYNSRDCERLQSTFPQGITDDFAYSDVISVYQDRLRRRIRRRCSILRLDSRFWLSENLLVSYFKAKTSTHLGQRLCFGHAGFASHERAQSRLESWLFVDEVLELLLWQLQEGTKACRCDHFG